MILRAARHQFTFPRPALVMGVLNVTPDSFSDGGHYIALGDALAHARRMVAEGADLIDVGGESTRPNAAPVSEPEELRRVLPVVEALSGEISVPISIDTVKPAVARACLAAGASLVNDIAGHRADPEMWRLVAEAGAGYVLMHMQGTPGTMQANPQYANVVEEISEFFADRLQTLNAAGLSSEHVVLDVGIGFGKSVEHNLQLLAGIQRFRRWKRPLLVGVSRKSFIGKLTDSPEPESRLPGSLAGACWAVSEGVHIIRAHDVAATRQALTMTEAIVGHLKHGTAGHPRAVE